MAGFPATYDAAGSSLGASRNPGGTASKSAASKTITTTTIGPEKTRSKGAIATKPKIDPSLAAAVAQVQAALAPSIQQTQEEARNKALGLKAAYAAAASEAAPVANQIGQTYSTAANAQAAFAKGFSDHVQSQLGVSADSANALLAQNGSPQHVNAPQIGDVLYGVGGYNSATLLNTAGAALKGAAQKVPDTLRGVGLQQYQGAMNEGTANVARLEAQRPSLVQTALAGIKADQFEHQKFGYEKQRDKRDAKLDRDKFDYTKQHDSDVLTIDQKNADREFALSVAKFNEDKRQFGLSQALEKAKASAPDYHFFQGANGGEWIFDPATGGLTQLTPGEKKPKYDATTMLGFKQTAALTAKDAFYGVKNDQAYDKTGKPIKGMYFNEDGALTAEKWGHPPERYQQAMADLLEHGVPLTVAQSALNRYWKRPGYEANGDARKVGKVVWEKQPWGRPVKTYQERNPGKGVAAAEPAATAAPADWRVALGPEGAGGVWRAPWSQTLSTSQMASVARQALAKVDRRLASASNVQALVSRMQQESGGQTGIVNKWDSNWRAGTPSIGLVQTIPSTFAAHALPGHTNIWDPLDNTIAGVRYMLSRYGRIVGSNGQGY